MQSCLVANKELVSLDHGLFPDSDFRESIRSCMRNNVDCNFLGGLKFTVPLFVWTNGEAAKCRKQYV